jgi:HEAT repeat protein
MNERHLLKLRFSAVALRAVAVLAVVAGSCAVALGQENQFQRELENLRQRLGSTEVEERRDALMRLENLKRPEGSRIAAAALADKSVTVRVAAAHAVIWLPEGEAPNLLIPMLKDKEEFVRREVAFALGKTRHGSAVSPLLDLLARDKKASVRAAAAIALGQIGDAAAAPGLSQTLVDAGKKKSISDEDEFVIRSAVRSLGQIGGRTAVPTLISALQNEVNSIDTRREAATALGLIGDPAALSALQAAFQANIDPYLSEAASLAIRQINLAKTKGAGN